MTQNLTNNAIIYAILALNSEVALQQEYLASDDVPKEDRDNEEDIVKGLDAGADDYVIKPFKDSELRSRINVGRRMLELQVGLLEKEKLQGVIEMSGAVCHEMNQPLQVVSGIAELLMLDIEAGSPLHEKVIILQEQAKRMGEITNKLMKITSYKTKAYLDSNIIDIDQSSRDNN